jgi:hypothetical protein
MIARLAGIELGSFFFQPLKFQLESANLLIEFGLACGLCSHVLGRVVSKHRRPFGEQLVFPIAYLGGMQVMVAGDFVDRFQSFDGFQCDVESELIGMVSTFLSHVTSSTGFLDYNFTLACGLVVGGQYTPPPCDRGTE